ncbi:M48 family metallopeptidase [Ottowia thiooxydans]|uniref:M48 family metallopeptidase n=1 Tax=Ottowia thiooxydans TaxID=219182 RepID=UPI00040BEC9B|nr:M48 family metallopeptidase [Ottowia thiooxydans]
MSVHRRNFFLTAGASCLCFAESAQAQVDVGKPSAMRRLVPAAELEAAAIAQYKKLLAEAKSKGVLVADGNPQLQRLRAIAARIVPLSAQWNDRAKDWRWEINLINSKQINAFCMPGGKIAFFTGILDELKLTDDEIAMIMGHEMAHALREHARERLAKTQATNMGLSLGAQWLGLGELGNAAAGVGTQLLALQFSRSDETEADLVGLELAARAGYNPNASVTLWQKMGKASGNSGGLKFLSTHPSGPNRIKELQTNVPKVQGLYEKTRQR